MAYGKKGNSHGKIHNKVGTGGKMSGGPTASRGKNKRKMGPSSVYDATKSAGNTSRK